MYIIRYCLNCKCKFHKNINCEDFQLAGFKKKNIPSLVLNMGVMLGIKKAEGGEEERIDRANSLGFQPGMRLKECPKCTKWNHINNVCEIYSDLSFL